MDGEKGGGGWGGGGGREMEIIELAVKVVKL